MLDSTCTPAFHTFLKKFYLIHWTTTTTTKEISEPQKCAKSWGRSEDSKTKKHRACLQGHSLKLRSSSMHSGHLKRLKCRSPGHTLQRQTTLSKTLIYKICDKCRDRWTHLGITEFDPRRETVGAEEWGTQATLEGQERIPGKEVNCWSLNSRINLEVTPCLQRGWHSTKSMCSASGSHWTVATKYQPQQLESSNACAPTSGYSRAAERGFVLIQWGLTKYANRILEPERLLQPRKPYWLSSTVQPFHGEKLFHLLMVCHFQPVRGCKSYCHIDPGCLALRHFALIFSFWSCV